MSNCDNYAKGTEFEQWVLDWFTNKYKKQFNPRVSVPIGSSLLDPSQYKPHKFDIVSEDKSIFIECKRYTWTESLNIPDAKIAKIDQAARYLSCTNPHCKKYIAIIKSYNPNRNETLAEYFFNKWGHTLGDIIIAEYDPDTKDMKFFANRYSI